MKISPGGQAKEPGLTPGLTARHILISLLFFLEFS